MLWVSSQLDEPDLQLSINRERNKSTISVECFKRENNKHKTLAFFIKEKKLKKIPCIVK